MSSSSTLRRRRATADRNRSRTRNRTSLIVLGAAVVVVLVALAIALAVGGDDRSDGSTGTAGGSGGSSPSGALPIFEGSGTGAASDDPAVGMTLPTLSGTDEAGQPTTISADGTPKMVVFLAHWCPHCQREVPVIQDWVDAGGLPSGVELVSVATATDPRRPNYPPEEWLAREGWTAPVLYDGDDGAAATAAGLSAFPFFVAVDGDGTVLQRSTGELTVDQLDAIAAQLAGTR